MKKIYNVKTGKITSEKTPPITQRITFASARHEPESYIEWATVDRVDMAIRSARGGATQPLFALYRDIMLTDAHIQAEMSKRKMAVLCDQLRIVPSDKKNQDDVDAAKFCEQQIGEMKSWRFALASILDGCLWPVAVAEKVFSPASSGYSISEIVPVPAHLLDYSTGSLRILATEEDGTPTGDSSEPDPSRYIVHRGHMLSSPDQFGGPMRALIYWWLASAMSRDWWVRFLERYCVPFMVGKYNPGAEGDKAVLLAAMSQATRTFGLAVSKNTEVELIEASKQSADAFAAFMAVAQREKSKLIVGQTLSAQTDPTGLGSGASDLQGEVREDIRKMDGAMLGETIRDQLFAQMCSINNLPGRAPRAVWGKASVAELKAIADVMATLKQGGLEAADSALPKLSDELGYDVQRATTPAPQVPMMLRADPDLRRILSGHK